MSLFPTQSNDEQRTLLVVQWHSMRVLVIAVIWQDGHLTMSEARGQIGGFRVGGFGRGLKLLHRMEVLSSENL